MRVVFGAALCAGLTVLASCAHVPRGVHVGAHPQLATITVSNDAAPSTRHAAEELQRFLGQITGRALQLVDTNPDAPRDVLIIGSFADAQFLLDDIDVTALGGEGYVIRSNRTAMVIVGGQPRGVLYGVYGLLEDYLGCRWFTPDVSRIPSDPNLVLPTLNERVVPVLEYREPFVMDCFDGDWAARNRVNSSAARLEQAHGGKVTYHGFVHTFEGLVPPDQYFESHPEYYSLINGKRLRERSQLCCTNPNVVKIVTDEIRKRMREHPEATVFSVSQNDWLNPCQCPNCKQLEDAEGTPMAPVLSLVNQVAAAVAGEFPDKLIDTLAYQYTRKAPKTMRPEPNVIIRLCSIECCFSHSFESCDSAVNRAFVEDVKAWSTVADRLWVWNYNTSFSDYFMPYPNLRVRDDNIRFYAAHNVRGIFEQDVYTTLHGELSELSGYLNAKLLWNPEFDEDTAIDEFLEGVYGDAAKPIRTYIDLLHNRVERENIHMDIWIGPKHAVLNDEVLERADSLWDKAEAAVASQPDVLERVRIARLPVDFAIIERTRTEGLSMFSTDATGAVVLKPELKARIDRFLDIATRHGVTNLREQNGSLELYRKQLESLVSAANDPTQPAVSVGTSAPGLRAQLYECTWNMLPDFAALTPNTTQTAATVTSDVLTRPGGFGMVLEGLVDAPRNGLYLFELTSNDGSKLWIGDRELINHDGLHISTTRVGVVSLAQGLHPIRVEYFNAGGKQNLKLAWESEGMARQEIPAEALSHAL